MCPDDKLRENNSIGFNRGVCLENMKTVHTIAELRQWIWEKRQLSSAGRSLSGHTEIKMSEAALTLVPTMGNLHAGHLDLVARARARAPKGLVVVSIFVNRLQFAPHEDFDAYPRTLSDDARKLELAGCDLLFAPTERDLYPVPQTFSVIPTPGLAGILEGEFRPGFFTGVCTVVHKLFNCVQPNIAFFGSKDFQQTMVIQEMVKQMALPIEIERVPTRREVDGLAMSSRNGYLSRDQRLEATRLFATLNEMVERFRSGERLGYIERDASRQMSDAGWSVDYLTIRAAENLLPLPGGMSPKDLDEQALNARYVVLGAARIGSTRLIDNVEFRFN